PQAPMTKASLTESQATVSTPLALTAAFFSMKPGRCLAEQVGVKAPGSANSTTFLPLNISSVVMSLMPSAVMCLSLTEGILSPTLIAIRRPLGFVVPDGAKIDRGCSKFQWPRFQWG